jgi:heme/copper-type cytochrome/quinol oxidase subunit 3
MSQTVVPPAGHQPPAIHLPKPSLMPLAWGAGFMLIAFGVIMGVARKPPGAPVAAGDFWLSGIGLVLILAATGGWLWGNIRERVHGSETPAVAAKFAMWCFLGTEVIIFGALIARVLGVWVQAPDAHRLLTQPLTSLLLVSVNTFLLLISSLCVVLGLSSIQHGNRSGLALWLAATAVLGAAFVGIQAYEFNKLVGEGLIFGTSQFASAFYLLTGNHGLHVIIGVIWCVVILLRALRGQYSENDNLGIEIFGLYWHFVDVVWILIFTLVYLI